MLPIRKSVIAIPVLATLGACANPTPPTITADQLTDIQNESSRVSALSASAPASIPTSGAVDYSGHIGGEIDGDVTGGFVGDLTVTADFGTNAITGDVTNINLIDEDGNPDQLLGGSLDVTGAHTGADITMTAQGSVTAVDDDGFRGSSDVDFELNGGFVDDTGTADAMYGTITGSADGDFYIGVVDADFYAVSQ